MGPGFHFSKEEKGEPEDLEDIRAFAGYGGTADDYERREGICCVCSYFPALWPGHQEAQSLVNGTDTSSKHCNAVT